MTTQVDERPDITSGERTDLDRPYNVFLWDDPVTPMNVVTRVLQKVFGYGKDRAELLMITAHLEGKVVVWTGGLREAERYCIRLGANGLQSTVGKDA